MTDDGPSFFFFSSSPFPFDSKEPLLLLLLLLCDVLHIDEERGTCAYNATVGHGLADDPQSSVDPDLIITALPTKKFQSVDKYLNLDYFDSEIGCGISLKNLFRNGAWKSNTSRVASVVCRLLRNKNLFQHFITGLSALNGLYNRFVIRINRISLRWKNK